METGKTVVDEKQKITDEQIGKIQKKTNEIVRRINEGTISYDDALEVMQIIIIEGRSAMYLNGASEKSLLTRKRHTIDCRVEPFTPPGWKIEAHLGNGLIEFDTEKTSLYLSEEQERESVNGFSLRNELLYKPVMPANVLDYLLANTELIPNDWKNKKVFFWGSIYCDSSGRFCVRYLYLNGSEWDWHYYWLDCDFDANRPAALVG